MTWTCTKCRALHPDTHLSCQMCGDMKPAELSEEERAALECLHIGQDIRGLGRSPADVLEADDKLRKSLVAEYRAARAPLEAELAKLREQLAKAAEMNHRQAKDIGDLEAYLGKDGTAFLHTGTPATVEAVRRIEELKTQLAQAEKPAAVKEGVCVGCGAKGFGYGYCFSCCGREKNPAAPAGLPEVGSLVFAPEWEDVARVTSHGPGDGFFGGKSVTTPSRNYSMRIEGEGKRWFRFPPAQTSREPGIMKQGRLVVGYDLSDGVSQAAYVEMIQRLDGTMTVTKSLVGPEAEAEIARREADKKPAASPPGEVSTEKLMEWLSRGNGSFAAVAKSIDGHVSAAVERETAKDKARIVELEASLADAVRCANGETEKLRAARAEVERLKGELARAKAARRCPADGMSEVTLRNALYCAWAEFGGNHLESFQGTLAKARELFTPSEPAPAQPERKVQVGDDVWTVICDRGRKIVQMKVTARKGDRFCLGDDFWWNWRDDDDIGKTWWWSDPSATKGEG